MCYFLVVSGNGIPEKVEKILHVNVFVKGTKRSLLFAVMSKKNMLAAQSILLQLEGYMHNYDLNAIYKCIFDHMGSGQLAKETIKSVEKLYSKQKINWKTAIKSFLVIFMILLPLKLSPITLDVVTDSLLLKEYLDAWETTGNNEPEFELVNPGKIFFILRILFREQK